MKKTFTILIAALMLLTMISQPTRLWGQERGTSNYTITFKTASNDNPSAYTTSTTCSSIVSGGSDYLTGNLVTATKVYGPGTYGLKMGTSSQSGVIKMNLSTAGQAYVISVVVRAKRYNSGTAATIAVNGKTAQSTTSSFADYTFTINSNITYLQLNASKYLWVESIVVNYTTYTVTYNANDANATGSTVDSDSPYKKGASVTVMDCGFEVAGKTFDGWYTNSSYTGTKYVPGDTYTNSISDDVTFYAKWTLSSPTLSVEPEEAETFTYSHGNGPSEEQMFQVTLVNSSNDITVSVESDDDVFEITDDVEYGVSDLTISSEEYFAVRLKEGLDIRSYSGTITITSDGATPIEIELSGTVTGYSVTYNGNGNTDGSVPTDNNVYEKNETVTVKSNSGSLVRTGYTFGGWNTKSDGTGTTYSAVPTLGTFAITENTTLYAKWNINSYNCSLTTTGETSHATIQLKNGDDVIAVPASIPYNTEITIDVTPESGYGYTYTVKDAGNNDVTVTDNKFNMPASAVTVTVNISESYNITVTNPISNGSVSVVGDVTSAAPGTTISLTATPSTDYNLAAWNVYKTGDASITVTVTNNQFTMPSYDVTVNATFDKCVVLPFEWEGGSSSTFTALVGVSASGLGSDYAAGNSPYLIKLDSDNDYILIKTNTQPGKVTIGVKMLGGGNTSTITVQESTDGETYKKVEDLTISGSQDAVLELKTTKDFASTSRYVKLLFTKGSNVGVGPITIAKYSTDPEINADDTDIACDALSGSIEFTITRPVVGGVLTAAITDGNEGSWLSLTPGTYTSEVPFTCSANSADNDREATVTLTYTYNTNETVTKDVTVTQGKRDYAMLTSDFTYDGNGTGTLPVGLTPSGLGTYSDSPKMKFDNTGDYLRLKLDEAPVQISYDIKGNSFSDGTFTVQLSEDGSSYEDLATHTTIENTNAKTFTHICNNSRVRYIRWIYTDKSTGNVGLGNIKVSKTATNSSTLSSTNTITVGRGSTLTFSGTCSDASWLVIEEGGQLIIPAAKDDVKATFQREVVGYGSSTDKDKYILLANPTTDDGGINPTSVGMLTNDYDLYYFDESKNGAEWRNYKKETFNLVNGKGYLYANSVTKTLNFAGTAPTATSVSDIPLSYTADNNFKGFNLIGNPMAVNITGMKINTTACPYYKLNDDGSFTTVYAANVSSNPVIVGQAFVVEASAKGDKLHLNPASKDANEYNDEVIRLEVSNSKYTDVAYICFGNSLPLTKINHLNDEAPMLYVHSESADRAVAVMNERSEVKSVNVNFEAKTMGTYTISGKAEKGNFSYMHLYDRLTGVDTDLLESDYTFIGSTTDVAGRFILRFEAIDNNIENESFAYQNGSDIIVNGEGELQIFDVMGRMVSTQHINGVERVNVKSQGVYIFRLNEKTQKIVVR